MTSRPAKPFAPDVSDAPQRERRPLPMRAPRPQSKPAWEPVPLHIPAPEPRERSRSNGDEEKTPRGVVIISYGDEE